MDVVKALKEIIQHHVETLSDDKKLRAMLKDYFPEDKRTQNTLMMVVDEGILDDMQGKRRINKFQMFGYIKGIVSDYGISEAVAKIAIMNWAKAIGIDAEDVPVDESSSNILVNKNIKATVLEYNDSIINENAVEGTILKFSGTGHRVYTGIKVENRLYALKLCADGRYIKIAYIDYKGNEETLSYVDCAPCEDTFSFAESQLDVSKPGIIKVMKCRDNWSVEMIPL